MTIKCNCGRRTPFAHKHAETCPCFQPQLADSPAAPAVYPIDHPLNITQYADEVFVWYDEAGMLGGVDYSFESAKACLQRYAAALNAPVPADPTDELGKVWDVLHAAGINSGGELSASEGVKLLADKVVQIKVLLNSNYGPGGIGRFVPDEPKPMCDHEWGAHRSQQCQQCVKCLSVRSFDE